ncbi:hypothetical protein SDC9_69732 [bioreactor metagenome]|uniref:VWFA domain-containing protein n=1 Tax=bioreactor metagenome TaxID=1076179 RepID=A0A644Y405_9ZZZZ
MYRFEHPEYLWWLTTLLAATGLFLLYYFARKKQLGKLFSAQNLKLTIPDFSKNKPLTKFALLALAAAFMIIALANPLAGKKVNKQVQSKGSDIQFVVDISNSMLCEDIKPNRLSKMKQIMLGMIERMSSDRAGLIVFAGDAFIQLPMTIDQTAVSMFVRNLDPELISRQGTHIEKALTTALVSIDSSKAKHPAIVLLSDGEDLEGDPGPVIAELQKRKIAVNTVAIGTEKGGPIPVYSSNVRVGYKKDAEGNTVMTKPNEELLKALATQTGGIFVGTKDLGNAAESIMNELRKAEKEENRSMVFSDYNSLYLWVLIPALLLLLFDFFLLEKRMKWQDLFSNFIERRTL